MYFCSVETDKNIIPEGRLTLRKSYKLRHKTLVDQLFASGESLYQYPLRLTFRQLTESDLQTTFRNVVPDRVGPVQILVTVPKKKLRHAVDRVLMRRRIREALRLRMPLLKRFVEESGDEIRTLSVGIVYLDKGLSSSRRIGDKLDRILSRLTTEKSSMDEAEI